MRHLKKINPLSRKSAHRKAMLSNMAASLILHKRITTTLAKAKVLRTYVEPIITKSKDDSTHSRRVVFSYLQNKEAVNELFREVAVKVAERPGGYTRILKTGNRLGDNAEMCIIELVDYNELMLGMKDEKKAKSTRRGRRGTSKKTSEGVETPAERKKEIKAETETAKPAEPVKEEETETPAAEDTSETPAAEGENENDDKSPEKES